MRQVKLGLLTCVGLLSCAATAYLVSVLLLVTHLNPYNLFLSYLPLGAVACGYLASLGYVAASRVQARTGWHTALLAAANAVASQPLSYVLIYRVLSTANGAETPDMTLGQFLVAAFHLTSAVTEPTPVVPAGTQLPDINGVGLMLLQFAGAAIGGLLAHRFAGRRPMCDTCDSYSTLRLQKTDIFPDLATFTDHSRKVEAEPVGSPAYLTAITARAAAKPESGSIRLMTSLLHCRRCKEDRVLETAQIREYGRWLPIREFTRSTPVPTDIDLMEELRPVGKRASIRA